MRRLRLTLLLAIILAGVGWGGYLGWQYLAGAGVAEVPELADGHQEVAWIAPATSGDSWERLVAALKNLEKDWPTVHADLPRLRVSFQGAFLEQTASVPQIALSFEGTDKAKLWIRWYKLGGEGHRQQWLEKLKNRGRPPLAIMGGDTSDRAISMAKRLESMKSEWSGAPPLLLITSATAYRFYPGDNQSTALIQDEWPKLMGVYKDRSFRFCFNTKRIAETVMDFLEENPQVWPEYQGDAVTLATALAQGNALGSLAVLHAAGHFRPTYLYTLAWRDDRYSQDLADHFWKEFVNLFYLGDSAAAFPHNTTNNVQYSVGDFFQPNPSELQAIGIYLGLMRPYANHHHLLAMPTGVHQARRFLRALCQQAPAEVHNVVVVSGDSINFNNVYRDRDLAWNVLDVPVPLVFFSHRNPVDESAGFREDQAQADDFSTTGTQDLLLLRDVIEALLLAARTPSGWSTDSQAVRDRMHDLRWHNNRVDDAREHPAAEKSPPLFDAEGDRQPRTGEHVVWLQPSREFGRILPKARLSIWRIDPQIADELTWKQAREPLVVEYNRGNHLEAGDVR